MKNSGRRQVKTPVGNKTKRGAELEGTPKTPRSFEVSPCKSTCMDTFSQEPEHRRLQVRSRRPLQWNDLAEQGINAMAAESTTEDSLENTLSPFLPRDLKSTGESEAVAALSPICVNAIRGNSDQQGGRIKAAMKKPNEMPPSLAFTKIKERDPSAKRKGHDRALGSCPFSPECQILPFTGERIFLWSNAAFNQRPAHEETVCLSKDIASSTSCSSTGSSARHKAAITERAECEAESKATDQDPLPKTDCGRRCIANGRQRESPVVDAKHGIGSSEVQETKPDGCRGECTELSESSLSRKLLFENEKSSSGGLVLEPDHGAFPYLVQQRSETKEHTDLQKSVMQAGQEAKKEEERVEIGLEEIEKEIQRLTERLTELHLQKLTREKEMGRHGEESTKKAETASHVGNKDQERSVVATMLQQRQGKRSAVTGAKRGKRAVSISGSSASVLQSPGAQSMRSCHEVASKLKEETPVNRRAHCPPTGSASKLSELRRSVSSANRRMESNRSSDAEADHRSKVLRRLSMSGSMISAPSNVQGQQQQPRSFSSKGSCTPSRVVSSRYGRAITPDACRPSGGSTIVCKKRDRPSSAASSPLPQPPASVASSPLKKVATLRSGYPSRSGFATPTKERQQLKSLSAIRTASNTTAPSPTSSLRAQNLGRLLHSPNSRSPVARVDSPKSTAALYKCLESLLEDSKHFFKRLSPARSNLHTHTLPQQLESTGADLAAAPCKPLEQILPSINTCRMDAISPRDSGCVKRVCDRQKRHFFFATQESLPQPLESALHACM